MKFKVDKQPNLIQYLPRLERNAVFSGGAYTTEDAEEIAEFKRIIQAGLSPAYEDDGVDEYSCGACSFVTLSLAKYNAHVKANHGQLLAQAGGTNRGRQEQSG